jgi:predicted DNA binding protein
MQSVTVTLTANGREAEIHPMYDVLATASFVEYATAMQWNLSDAGFGILHYVEGDVDAFEAAVTAVDIVVDYAIEPVTDDAFYAYVRDEATPGLRAMLDPLENGGVVVVPPIVYHGDGTVTLTAFGPSEEMQGVFERTPAPIELDVEAVGSLESMTSLADARLSSRQRAAVDAALALGYYEVPREASVEDVADELACAPSTAAEHLRKAESTLVRSSLGDR